MTFSPRFLLYCHNVVGLGHVTRTLRIAAALMRERACRVRLITGCRFLDRLALPDGLEVTRLPAVGVGENGRLIALDGSPAGAVMQARTQRIAAEVAELEPHVVLVDHNPIGLLGELTRALDAESGTRFVWGVRDIWGTPEYLAKRRWFGDGPAAAASRMDRFHSAIAFTDPSWIDTFSVYRELKLPRRLQSVGFVTGAPDPASARAEESDVPPLVVALFGGGAEADAFVELLRRALKSPLQRRSLRLRLVVGPFSGGIKATRERLGTLAGVEVRAEGSAEASIADADLVICRAGYNTAYSVVQSPAPVIFVPIAAADEEQTQRAARLAELEGVEWIRETAADAAERLENAVARGLRRGRAARVLPFATDGAERAARALFDVATRAVS